MSIENVIKDSIKVKEDILADVDFLKRIENAAELCIKSLQNGGKIHLCGNGGSAADSEHIAGELLDKRIKQERNK